MRSDVRTLLAVVASILVARLASAEPVATPVAAAANLDFEEGVVGEAPSGWRVPEVVRQGGWTAKLVEDGAASGARHAVLAHDGTAPRRGFGNILQSVDAKPLRGKAIRLAGRGRVEGDARLQLWLRVDRSSGTPGFFDNCQDRPIVSADWAAAEIIGVVDADAERLVLGALVLGGGTAHVDALRLETLDVTPVVAEPARAVTSRGLANLEAFARLYGIVRFFHASDEVAAADWEGVAIHGVRVVEAAADPAALAAALEGVFRPITPMLRAHPTVAPPADLPSLAKPPEATRSLAWLHAGVGFDPRATGIYSSRRITPEELPSAHRLPGQMHLVLDATPLRGRELRLRAAVRVLPAAPAKMSVEPGWYAMSSSEQVAGEGAGAAAVDAQEWTPVELALTVPNDARRLFLGFRATGEGRAFVDDVRLDVGGLPLVMPGLDVAELDAHAQVPGQPPRGWLSPEISSVEGWRASISTDAPRTPPHCALLETVPIERPALPDPTQPFVVDLPGGVTCRLPLAVHADAQHTLPRGTLPASADRMELLARTTEDRATRLAAVVIAWSTMQHFYPYFDVIGSDWAQVLPRSLGSAATDADAQAFGVTMRRLGAALEDGHVRIGGLPETRFAALPLAWDVVEETLVVTAGPAADEVASIHLGDVVTAIDGEPALAALAREESLVSGATAGWRQHVALMELARAPLDRAVALDILDASGEARRIELQGSSSAPSPREKRPSTVEEVRAGIVYVDLDRATDAEIEAAFPLLERADGIVLDLRGYPASSTIALAHLTDVPLACARWNVPVTAWPDRREVTWQRSRWPVMPEPPRWKAKVAFVTDGGAISYAETYLAIVEAYGLGEIVGAPTAGTNGNVNVVPLPGGLSMSFTGMKVLKHDGSRHHGVGVLPTVPVARTLAGVRAGKDELLERAIQIVSGKPASIAEQP